MSEDDEEFAEVDLTEDEFDAILERGEDVELVNSAHGRGVNQHWGAPTPRGTNAVAARAVTRS